MIKQSSRAKRIRRRPKSSVPRPRKPTDQVFSFRRKLVIAAAALNTGAITSSGLRFMLSDVPNSSEFTSLFDLYKIDKIDVQCLASFDTSTGPPQTRFFFATVVDLNSSGALASFADALEFQSVKVLPFQTREMPIRSFRPRYIGVAEDSSSSVIASTSDQGWLNTSIPNIPHYGFRWVSEAASTSATMRFIITYHLLFKQVK